MQIGLAIYPLFVMNKHNVSTIAVRRLGLHPGMRYFFNTSDKNMRCMRMKSH